MADMEHLYRSGVRYRKTGVVLTGLQDACGYQPALFDCIPVEEKRSRSFMEAVDTINARWGRGTVGFGAPLNAGRAWRMRRRFMSGRYTTCWSELPTVRA